MGGGVVVLVVAGMRMVLVRMMEMIKIWIKMTKVMMMMTIIANLVQPTIQLALTANPNINFRSKIIRKWGRIMVTIWVKMAKILVKMVKIMAKMTKMVKIILQQ